MNDNHDEQGRFATAEGTTFMGSHARMDKLAANAHAKAEAVKPENHVVTKVGSRYVTHAEGDKSGLPHKTKGLAERHAAMLNQSHRERVSNFHSERAARATQVRGYLSERAGRDAKYGKQLKLPL